MQYEQQDFEQQQGFENMNFDQNVYSGEYEGQQEFPDFQSELYNETYSTDEQQSSQPESGENIDLGLLLLQDLVHSDEDDEDSDDDIPLDDGDEEIPLDDGMTFSNCLRTGTHFSCCGGYMAVILFSACSDFRAMDLRYYSVRR